MSERPGGPREPYAIGCDIGVTYCKIVCVTREGVVLRQKTTKTNADSPEWPVGVRGEINRIETEHGGAYSIGVAAPGIADPMSDSISWMQGRLDGVQGLNWTEFLARQPHDVPVLNDAHAALLGEAWVGAAKNSRNIALLTLGTGVGGALMVDGRLLRGDIGRAGHLGHVCLDVDGPPDVTNCPGSLENAIGNVTVEARTGGRFKTTHDLVAAHLAGDAEATRVWRRSVQALAAAVASIINVADPNTFVIGGGIARAKAPLFDLLGEYLDRYEWRPHGRRVKIVPAALGGYSGALGAAWAGIEATDNF